mgnify:FL=1
MPKLHSEIITPKGKAKVEAMDLIKKTVKAKFEKDDGEVEYEVYKVEEIKATEVMADDNDDTEEIEEYRED